jgi:threonine dehydrogenase-like Zn-dependent dehydrogenase
MKAAYVKAPFEITLREVNTRPLRETEVRIEVKACGVCGSDLISARYYANEAHPFGHEIAGIVRETGSLVRNVKAGDRVVLESGTFDRFSNASRNGRVDLDGKGPNFWVKGEGSMGFAREMIAPCEACVVFDNGLSFEQTVLTEPLGVAMDMVKTADIKLLNDVLVIGLGPIGLMAARIAKIQGARKVYGAANSHSEARIALAKKWGIDGIINSDKIKIEDYQFERGGVDRVLVTAPPETLVSAINVCNTGGIVAFVGISYGPESTISVDANTIHFKKLQVRGSHAAPALYFPECLDLISSGAVDTKALITHRFKLEDIKEAIKAFDEDKKNGIKAVMIND